MSARRAWVPAGIALGWAGLVVLIHFLQRRGGEPIVVCLFRRITSKPCPTCGGTRATFAMLSGDVAGAFVLNPLVALLTIVGPMWLVWFYWPGRRRIQVSAGGWRLATVLVVGAVVLNWVYVLRRDGAG